MESAGLPVRLSRVLAADFDESTAYRQVKQLLQRDPEVDALFCASDLMALGACKAIEEAGFIVGQDIAVVGFDDIPVAKHLYGGLTTIRQDFYLMGYMAGKAIYERIEGREAAGVEEMMYELVIRGSARGTL